MNTFYTYPKSIQWAVTIFLFLIACSVMGAWLMGLTKSFLWYLAMPAIVPVLQFSMTPFFRMIGLYHYLSPMLLVYAPSPQKYDLHNGTSFDYLFVMRNIPKGRPTQNAILAYYMAGLLAIVEKVERQELPGDLIVSGTSYFFSESTARKETWFRSSPALLPFEIQPIHELHRPGLDVFPGQGPVGLSRPATGKGGEREGGRPRQTESLYGAFASPAAKRPTDTTSLTTTFHAKPQTPAAYNSPRSESPEHRSLRRGP